MSDSTVRNTFNTTSDNISRALAIMSRPGIAEVFRDFDGFLGGAIGRHTELIQGAGIKMDYEVQPSRDGGSLGALTYNTAYPHPSSQMAFDNVIYTEGHLLLSDVPGAFDKQRVKILTGTPLAQYVTRMMEQAIKAYNSLEGMLMACDTRNFFANVAITPTITGDETTPTGDCSVVAKTEVVDGVTYTGYYVLKLYLGAKTYPSFLQKGRPVAICGWNGAADGAYFYGSVVELDRLRNYTTPGVCSYKTIYQDSPKGGKAWVAVNLSFRFTAANKTALFAELGAIAAGDVLCPWGGATAATGTMPSRGPNYGTSGLWHWMSQNNINSATWCGVPLQSEYTGSAGRAFASVDRTAEEFDFLSPYLGVGTGTIAAPEVRQWLGQYLDNLAFNIHDRLGGKTMESEGIGILIHPILVKAMQTELGVNTFRDALPADAATKERFGRFGITGVTYQNVIGGKPTVMAPTNQMSLDMVCALNPDNLKIVEPAPPDWSENGSGGVYHDVRYSDGNAGDTQATPRTEVHRVGRMVGHLDNAFCQGAELAVKPK